MSACNGNSPTDQIEASRKLLDGGQADAAIRSLKNAIKERPDSLPARLALAEALMASGDAASATVELDKLLTQNADRSIVLPILARALLQHGEAKKVIDRFSDVSVSQADGTAELKTAVAAAHFALGQRQLARQFLDTALAASPQNPYAVVMDVRFKTADGQFIPALDQVNALLSRLPAFAPGWSAKADALLKSGAPDAESIKALGTAVTLNSRDGGAHGALISVFLHTKDLEGARKQIQALRKSLPGSPLALYYEAQLSYIEGKTPRARELVQQLLKSIPDDVLLLQLAGGIELQAGALPQAEAYLGKSLALYPALPLSRRMLASVYVRQGLADRAQQVLAPLLNTQPPNPIVDSLAAEAALLKGDLSSAERFFSRALQANPTDTELQTTIAISRLRLNDSPNTLNELAEITKLDKGTVSDLALITEYTRRGQLDLCLQAIDRLEKKIPASPLPHHLRGRVHIVKQDQAQGRIAFERALALDPSYYPAAASLAALDQADGKFSAATARFETILKNSSKNSETLLALATLKNLQHAPSTEVEALIRKAVGANPTEVAPRLRLIEFLAGRNAKREALLAAQDAAAAMPGDLKILDALGRAQVQGGEINQAIQTFSKLSALQPSNPEPLLSLGAVYSASQKIGEARRAYAKALDLSPNNSRIQASLIATALRERGVEEALRLCKTVQERSPQSNNGWIFCGDVQFGRKDFSAAAREYQTAWLKSSTIDVGIKLHRSLIGSTQVAKAIQFEAEMSKAFKDNPMVWSYFGDQAIVKGDFQLAETHYRRAVGLSANDAFALNNLAYSLLKQKKESALDFAERAYKIDKTHPAIVDTLSQVMVENGRTEEAISLLTAYLKNSPRAYDVKYSLANTYLATRHNKEAKAIFEEISGAPDGAIPEATRTIVRAKLKNIAN